jgi:hypothetical protein
MALKRRRNASTLERLKYAAQDRIEDARIYAEAFPDRTRNIALLLGGGALLAFFLWPKGAKADGAKKVESAEVPQAGGTQGEGGTFTDAATGKELEGPSTSLAPTPKYIVQPKESWSNIASRVYGDYRLWPFLWDWNRVKFPSKYQASPDAINVGDEIELPAVTIIPTAPAYLATVQARADLHNAYWICVKKNGRTRCGAMDPSVLVATPLVS